MGGRRRKRVAGIIAEEWVYDQRVHLRVQRVVGLSRMRGLIARPPLDSEEAMYFERCRSVHGAFMNRRIVVVFLDEQLRITSVRSLRPWRVVADRAARHALEIEETSSLQLGWSVERKNSFASRGERFARSNP